MSVREFAGYVVLYLKDGEPCVLDNDIYPTVAEALLAVERNRIKAYRLCRAALRRARAATDSPREVA